MFHTCKTNKIVFWLILCLFLPMNQLSAQTIQTEADQHHSYWQQTAEGVVMARHENNINEYGSAGLTSERGFKPDKTTVFEIGSITKVFTSILLAEAVRENRAKFDDSVSAHLNELTFEKSSPFHTITLTELATHTSGLPRLPVDLNEGADGDNPYVHYDDQRLVQSMVAFRKDQLGEPGESAYSNYGVGILGYVLSRIYNQSYRELLKEKILDPLQMTSTDVPHRYVELPDEVRAKIATPHFRGKAVSHWELASLVGAGAMISSAEDLIKFGKAHWDDKTPAGLASSLSEVAKPRMDNQGLGWSIEGNSLMHGGGTGGFRTHLTVNPKDKTVDVFLSNSAGASHEVSTEGDFKSIQGHWSGVLDTGSSQLRLVTYLSESGRMVLYSVDQGLQPVLSAKSSFMNDQIVITFPSIEALYKGEFVADDLIGTFVQGGGKGLPLTMTRSKDTPDILRKGLDETLQGDLQSLRGYWSGYLGGKEGLFVYMKNISIGPHTVLEIYSPEQSDEKITVSSARLKNRTFELRSRQIEGEFSGELAQDLQTMEGVWAQGSERTPITLRFSEEKPVRE